MMMQIALPGTGSGPVAAVAEASPRRLLHGQHALMAVIAGVTWLALVGGVLSTYILSGAGGTSGHYVPVYAAHDLQDVVLTSYGTFQVTRAELTPLADSVEVHVTMRAENKLDGPAEAPRVDDLRLINSSGSEGQPINGSWNGPAFMLAHSTAIVDLAFRVAQGKGGLLWLEYREPTTRWPNRFALGAVRAPLPAAAVGVGEVE
jgi:hypothetical protein